MSIFILPYYAPPVAAGTYGNSWNNRFVPRPSPTGTFFQPRYLAPMSAAYETGLAIAQWNSNPSLGSSHFAVPMMQGGAQSNNGRWAAALCVYNGALASAVGVTPVQAFPVRSIGAPLIGLGSPTIPALPGNTDMTLYNLEIMQISAARTYGIGILLYTSASTYFLPFNREDLVFGGFGGSWPMASSNQFEAGGGLALSASFPVSRLSTFTPATWSNDLGLWPVCSLGYGVSAGAPGGVSTDNIALAGLRTILSYTRLDFTLNLRQIGTNAFNTNNATYIADGPPSLATMVLRAFNNASGNIQSFPMRMNGVSPNTVANSGFVTMVPSWRLLASPYG